MPQRVFPFTKNTPYPSDFSKLVALAAFYKEEPEHISSLKDPLLAWVSCALHLLEGSSLDDLCKMSPLLSLSETYLSKLQKEALLYRAFTENKGAQGIALEMKLSLNTICSRKNFYSEVGVLEKDSSSTISSTILSLLQDPSLSYIDIAQKTQLSKYSISRNAKKLRAIGMDLPVRKRGRIPEKSRGNPLTKKVESLLEDLLSVEYTFSEIAEKHDVSRQYVSSLLPKYLGVSGGEYFRELNRKRKGIDLFGAQQSLLDMLAQYTFDRIKKEESLAAALAWRTKNYSSLGKKISEETLSNMIQLYFDGEGYYRITRLSGLAEDPMKIKQKVPYVRQLLQSICVDIPIERDTIPFLSGKTLSVEEEEQFQGLYTTGVSHKDIAEGLGIPVSSVHYHKHRLQLEPRKFSLGYSEQEKTLAIQLFEKNLPLRAIMEQTGASLSTISLWKRMWKQSHESNSI
mgnify:CR=1 FL=1